MESSNQRGNDSMKIHVVKRAGVLFPASEEDEEKLSTIKAGKIVELELTQKRNLQMHRKLFAALNIGFDAFEPALDFKGRPMQKNFDRFRKDIIILAGFYDVVVNVHGEPRYEAKSISFGSMSQEEFESLYGACVNAMLKHVLVNYTRSDFDQVVEKLIKF